MAQDNFLVYKMLDVIVNHPKDTITVKEIIRKLPSDAKHNTIRSYIKKIFTKHGYLEQTNNTYPRHYRILKRVKENLYWGKKEKVKHSAIPATMSDGDIGRWMFAAHDELKKENHHAKESYRILARDHTRIVGELQDTIRKQKDTINKQKTRIEEQHRIIENQRNKIKDLEDDLSDLRDRLSRCEVSKGELQATIRGKNKTISDLRNKLSELNGKIFRSEDW